MKRSGPEQVRAHCVATISPPEGRTTAQGLPVAGEGDTADLTLAMTGGTGRYAGAADHPGRGP